MKTHIIQLEAHDDALSVRDKMGWGQAARIVLVWPKKTPILTRRLDLVLLQRHSQAHGVQLALVTDNPQVRDSARQLNIPIFKSLRQAQSSSWRKGRRRGGPKNPERRSPRPDLYALREYAHPSLPAWYETRTARRMYYSITLLIFLAAASFIMPGAQVYLLPQTKVQSITYQASTSEFIRTPNIVGEFPAIRKSLVVEGQLSFPVTNTMNVPAAGALGIVRFTNLTENSVRVPEGTIVAAQGGQDEQTLRFAVTRAGNVPRGPGRIQDLPVRALSPGAVGNLSSNRITAVEGPLGLSLSVTNPAPTYGGLDRAVASPSLNDYAKLMESLSENLYQAALENLHVEIPAGNLTIPTTLVLEEVLLEQYNPPKPEEGQVQNPAEELSLILRLEFSVLTVSEKEMHHISNQILDANLPLNYLPLPETLRLTYPSDPQSDDNLTYRWRVKAERKIEAALPLEKVVQATRGRTVERAKESLIQALDLSMLPEIYITPDWWPWMPVMPLRIQLIPGPAPLTIPASGSPPSPLQ